MNDELMQNALRALLDGDVTDLNEAFLERVDDLDLDDDGATPSLSRVSTFAEDGVLTTNKGLVLRLSDGTEYQLTLVQSR